MRIMGIFETVLQATPEAGPWRSWWHRSSVGAPRYDLAHDSQVGRSSLLKQFIRLARKNREERPR